MLTLLFKTFSIVPNCRRQFPMHIVTQNIKNNPETINILYQAMPRSFEVVDDNGMLALHYACLTSTDVDLVRTILSYKKDNININTSDGSTALDLVMARTEVTRTNQAWSKFGIELVEQEEIIRLLRENGAKTSREMTETMNKESKFYSL